MVYFKESQTWLQQSTLLIEARPTTTKISTRYTLYRPKEPSTRKSKDSTAATPSATEVSASASAATTPSRAELVLKTYDPVSGTCLKYRTDKVAEVGRLISGLGRCARAMAALPPKEEMPEAPEVEVDGKGAVGLEREIVVGKDGAKEVKAGQGKGAGGGGGGGGKKKKGKR